MNDFEQVNRDKYGKICTIGGSTEYIFLGFFKEQDGSTFIMIEDRNNGDVYTRPILGSHLKFKYTF